MWLGRFILAGTLAVTASCGASLKSGISAQEGCGENALCLNVKLGGPGALPAAQLMVVWTTPGVEAPLEVAYRAPFDAREATVRIDFAQMAAPTERARYPAVECDAGGVDCRANPVATAYVFVIADSSTGTIDFHTLIGSAPVMLGFASLPIQPGERVLSELFPGGMRQGLGLYTPVRREGRLFDQLWPAAPGAVFELLVCPPDGSVQCEPPAPNIT